MRAVLLALVLATGPGPQPYADYVALASGTLISDAPLTSAVTFDPIAIGGWDTVTVWVDYEHGSGNVTHVTLSCADGPSTSALGTHQSFKETSTDGTYDGSNQLLRIPVSASGALRWSLVGLSAEYFQCTVAALGTPDGTDLVKSISMRAGVQR
jgi:hypothetical protein